MFGWKRMRSGKNNALMGKGMKLLLQAIESEHSIKKATALTGLSYPKAMCMLKTFEQETGFPAVVSQKGGKNFGGSCLTDRARTLLERYCAIEQAVSA